MITHTDEHGFTRHINGAAHIVIALGQSGSASLRSFVARGYDAIYPPLSDEHLCGRALPALLSELRNQLQALPAPTTTGANSAQAATESVALGA